MPALIDHYPNSLQSLTAQFARAVQGPETRITKLAREMVENAQRFDMLRARDLGLNWKYRGLKRDPANPPEFDHESIVGTDWSDDRDHPLEPGEEWNAGRRATDTGEIYGLGKDDRPVNPYMNTGMDGRGTLGQFGPNHAVDFGTIVIKPGDTGAKVYFSIGITRKFDNDAPAFNGGFVKFSKSAGGQYIADGEAAVRSRVEEFFEEMISASVPLLPEFGDQAGARYRASYEAISAKRGGKGLSADQSGELMEQVITALKLEQAEKHDPGFMLRLEDQIRTAIECFTGPVLCDNRGTNKAWIESRLAWIIFNDDIWHKIKGDNPAFDYQLKGGDDASDVKYLELGPDLIQCAYASHGAMMVYMAASFLLYAQENSIALDEDVVRQMEYTNDFLKQYKPLISDTALRLMPRPA
jgi:hypothetical protein